MNAKMALASAALALPLLAGPASAAPNGPAKQCFYSRDVSGFNAVDNDHVYVSTGVKDVYELTLFGGCQDVDWTLRIGLVSHGGNFICEGSDAELLVPSSIAGPQRCPVSQIRKLTPAEVAALPKKARP
jgi:hypothetical protein